MATASRTRPTAGSRRPPRPRSATALLVRDALGRWLVPAVAGGVITLSAVLGGLGQLPMQAALGSTIVAALVILLYVGLRPLLAPDAARRTQILGALVGTAWLAVCYAPFYARLFPGTALVADVQITAAGTGLPLRIPAAGRSAIDLVLEGHLDPTGGGSVAPPQHFVLTLSGGDGALRTLEGTFKETRGTRRLGRRGSAVVTHQHTAEVRVLPNPTKEDITLSGLVLEPAGTHAITLTAYPHPLPGPLGLGLAVVGLLAGIVAFDRLGLEDATDGALTLATAAVIGAAVVFWTSNTVHPDYSTLIGAAIFGGPLGFGAGALLWWVAKRLLVRPAR
jgi:hypothetical protein